MSKVKFDYTTAKERICFTCKLPKQKREFFPGEFKHPIRAHCKECVYKKHKDSGRYNSRGHYKPKRAQYSKPFEKDGIMYKICRKCQQPVKLSDIAPYSALCRSCFTKANSQRYKNYVNRHPAVKLKEQIRAGIIGALQQRSIRKTSKTAELLGTSDLNVVREHIESRFQPGMTWENHGQFGWHYDHIKPCSSFDLTKVEEQKKCFHYTNLQPLWWQDNLSKADKL